MTITEKQLRSRARRTQEAEAKLTEALAYRDAGIIQAVAEGRSQTEVAVWVGVTKARIGRIVAQANGEGSR